MSTGSPLLTLLFGKERFLKKEFIAELSARLLPDGTSLNFQEFHAQERPLSELFDFLNTSPFGAQHRLAVFWAVDDLESDDRERFLKALERLPSSAALVLETEQTNPKKDSFLKKLSEKTKTQPCHPPFERDLPGWLRQRARKSGLTLDPRVLSYLLSCSGGELATLATGIQQLAVFVHPKTSVSLADAQALFQKRAEDDVFRLAELLMDQKRPEALRVLEALFAEGARAPEIVAALATQFERWKKGSARLAQGRSSEEVGHELRVPPFFQAAFIARLKRLTPEWLRQATQGLLRCDESFKSGQADERLALERFIWTS